MNKVFLIGNLTKNPELKSTSAGTPVCNFTVAVNRRFRNSQTGQQETDFLNVVAWRQLAELCSRYLSKGRKVAVTGSIQTRTYEAKDGTKRVAWDIVAEVVSAHRRTPHRTATSRRPARTAGRIVLRSIMATTAGSPRWTTTNCRFKR